MNTLAWNIAPNKAPMISIAEINVIESSERNIECFVLRLIPCNESIPRWSIPPLIIELIPRTPNPKEPPYNIFSIIP